jgi:hypothetical protein
MQDIRVAINLYLVYPIYTSCDERYFLVSNCPIVLRGEIPFGEDMRVTSPVILTAHMKEAIKDGAWIEVECIESAVARGNTHRGEWKIYVCAHLGGTINKAIYVSGRNLEPRIYKTVAGLQSFGMEMGLEKRICIPIQEGEIEVWEFEESERKKPT